MVLEKGHGSQGTTMKIIGQQYQREIDCIFITAGNPITGGTVFMGEKEDVPDHPSNGQDARQHLGVSMIDVPWQKTEKLKISHLDWPLIDVR